MKKTHKNHLPQFDRWAYLWLVIAVGLFLFTYGMYRNPLGGLLAYIFLLRFTRSKKVGSGYLMAFLALAIANTIGWWNTDFALPPIARIIFGLFVGLMYSIPVLLDRVLVRRFQGFASTLVFPVVSAAFEFLTIWPNPLTSYGSLAYSQFGNAYLTQVVSITGLWGVTFLVSWFAAMVNWIWEEGAAWPRIRRGVTVYASVMLVILLYGVIRLTYFMPQPGTVRVHGVVENDYTRQEWVTEIKPLQVADPDGFRAATQSLSERYIQATIRQAQAGAQIVVWPELAVEGSREDIDTLLEDARQVARQEGIYLVMGLGVVPPSNPERPYLDENKLIILDPQGQIVVDQVKYGCGSTRIFGFDI